MSNPLVELKKILGAGQSPEIARVLSVGNDQATVVSSSGTRNVACQLPVSRDDFVLVSGGVVQGKVADPSKVPTYYV